MYLEGFQVNFSLFDHSESIDMYNRKKHKFFLSVSAKKSLQLLGVFLRLQKGSRKKSYFLNGRPIRGGGG